LSLSWNFCIHYFVNQRVGLRRPRRQRSSLTITQANVANLLLRAGRSCSGGPPPVKGHIGTMVCRLINSTCTGQTDRQMDGHDVTHKRPHEEGPLIDASFHMFCQYTRKNQEFFQRFGTRKCTLQHVYQCTEVQNNGGQQTRQYFSASGP